MLEKFAVKSPAIIPLHNKARELAFQFLDRRFVWVPRESNAEADAESREGLDSHPIQTSDPIPSPLARFTTEQLIEELKGRGVPVAA